MEKAETELTAAIIEKTAAREGVSVTELREPLYDVIDPEALEMLFTNATGRVVFRYLGYQITAHSDGSVKVDTPEEGDRHVAE